MGWREFTVIPIAPHASGPAFMKRERFCLRRGVRFTRGILALFWKAIQKYNQTDAGHRAASFAFYAFFALFPLAVLLITLGTLFFSNGSGDAASSAKIVQTIISQVKEYLPDVPGVREEVVRALEDVWRGRQRAGLLAFGILVWSALQFFQSLVQAINRAWGTSELVWWRLPGKNLLMLGIVGSALFFGALLPALWDQASAFFLKNTQPQFFEFEFLWNSFRWVRVLVPSGVLFYGLTMFYKVAPQRRTTFQEVWGAALFVTLALNALQICFSMYARAVIGAGSFYGIFGVVMLLLMWIYLSGAIVIFGGCLCVSAAESSPRFP